MKLKGKSSPDDIFRNRARLMSPFVHSVVQSSQASIEPVEQNEAALVLKSGPFRFRVCQIVPMLYLYFVPKGKIDLPESL